MIREIRFDRCALEPEDERNFLEFVDNAGWLEVYTRHITYLFWLRIRQALRLIFKGYHETDFILCEQDVKRLKAFFLGIEMLWVSTLDGLPDLLEPVLTCYSKPGAMGVVTKRYRVSNGWYDMHSDRICPNKNVTHWMPLPELPECEKESDG